MTTYFIAPRPLRIFQFYDVKDGQKKYDIMDGKIIWHTWLLFSEQFPENVYNSTNLVHAGRYLCVVKLCYVFCDCKMFERKISLSLGYNCNLNWKFENNEIVANAIKILIRLFKFHEQKLKKAKPKNHLIISAFIISHEKKYLRNILCESYFFLLRWNEWWKLNAVAYIRYHCE